MVFEVVTNHVFVKLSVPSFGVSPARTVRGASGSTIMGRKNRRDIVSSFAEQRPPRYALDAARCPRCDADHTPRRHAAGAGGGILAAAQALVTADLESTSGLRVAMSRE